MSSQMVRKTLEEFISSSVVRSLILKGEWGVGKTYFWDKLLQDSRHLISRSKYSYVSLFGIGSLSELKRSISENTVDKKFAGFPFDVAANISNILSMDFGFVSTAIKKVAGHAKDFKLQGSSISGVVDSIQFSRISDTLICIDDFERRGSALSARDVMGLISHLIEKKDCMVVLILNDGYLSREDEFFKFSEKVFDREVKYSPTPKDSGVLVFRDGQDFYADLIEYSEKLKICNIRILSKMKFFADELEPYILGQPSALQKKAAMLLALMTFIRYGGADCPVTFEYIEGYTQHSNRTPLSGEKESEQERAEKILELSRRVFLQDYGFMEFDDFSKEIVSIVKNGFIDSESVRDLVAATSMVVAKSESRSKILKAWQVYHKEFQVPCAQVLDMFERAFLDSFDVASPNDMDGCYSVFKDAGDTDRGVAIVDAYFSYLSSAKTFTSSSQLWSQPKTHYVIKKLDEYLDSLKESLDLNQLLDDFMTDRNEEATLNSLSCFSAEEFCQEFRAMDSEVFHHVVPEVLNLGNTSEGGERGALKDKIFKAAFEAIVMYSKDSRLMKHRMRRYLAFEDIYDEKWPNP